MKHLVFIFKFDRDVDFNLLRISNFKQKKNYKYKSINISGEFTQQQYDLLKSLNVFDNIFSYRIPEPFSLRKVTRINYQSLKIWDILKEEYVICYRDIFPFKEINDDDFNKEYRELYSDYNNIPKNEMFWWLENYIKMLQYVNKKYKTNFKNIYEAHNFHTIDEGFINFINENKELLFLVSTDMFRSVYDRLNNRDVFKKDLIRTTYFANKWIWQDNPNTKGVNLTIPTDIKSRELLQKLTGYKVDERLKIIQK